MGFRVAGGLITTLHLKPRFHVLSPYKNKKGRFHVPSRLLIEVYTLHAIARECAEQQTHHNQNEEDEQYQLSATGCQTCQAAKSEEGSNQSDNE
jgi:hypothetical protein